jgi:lipopolysaccharide transport system permease protein
MRPVVDDHTTATAGDPLSLPVTRIQRSTGMVPLNLRDLWGNRELLYFLIWGDLKLRYKQTALGATWAILQPLLTMIIFSIFFGRLARLPTDGIPYPLFVYTALVPWTYFSNAMNLASASLIRHEKVITKVYFPRLIVPMSAVAAGLVDLGISFVLLLGLLLYYGMMPTAAVVMLPLFVLLAVMTALAVSLWMSALNVQYRDVRYTLAFLTQVWLFLTPIVYSTTLIPENWRTIYGLNPMAGVVEGFRWSLLGSPHGPGPMLLVSVLMVTMLLIGGLYYFRRMEQTFADVV